jgi:hypothetical protein
VAVKERPLQSPMMKLNTVGDLEIAPPWLAETSFLFFRLDSLPGFSERDTRFMSCSANEQSPAREMVEAELAALGPIGKG